MGKRQDLLKIIVTKEFFIDKSYKKPSDSDFFNSPYNEEIKRVYLSLGGIQSNYPTRYKGYDIQCSKFIVELDEERHFNRYRAITLKSKFYDGLNTIDVNDYKNYCQEFESCCLSSASWSSNWTTSSSVDQFGPSSSEGCLQGNGSARWKQRAFYDYLRDISSKLIKMPIIRISIWEKIDNKNSLNYYLSCHDEVKILSFIKKKVKMHSC